MQQRLWSYSSRVPDQEHAVVAIRSAAPQQPQLKHHHHHTPRTNPDGLPHYDPRSGFGKKEGSWRSESAEKWIHVIPVIVLFCLFVLWWFSVSGITNWGRVWVSWVYLFDFFDGFLFLGNWWFWFLVRSACEKKAPFGKMGVSCLVWNLFLGSEDWVVALIFLETVTCDSCVWLSGITNWDKVSISCFSLLDFFDGFLFLLWFLVHWKQIAVAEKWYNLWFLWFFWKLVLLFCIEILLFVYLKSNLDKDSSLWFHSSSFFL